MRPFFLPLIIIFFGFSACNQINRDHISSNPADSLLVQAVVGEWAGTLPCADCSGIHFELALQPEGTYAETSVYEGKDGEPVKQEGNWSMSADSVVMLEKEENEGHGKFRFKDGQLQMLDIQGNEIDSQLAEQYLLTKNEITVEGVGQPAAKQKPGIDFTARGNEPFWLLEIDFEKGMFYKGLNEPKEFNTPMPKAENNKENEMVSYRAETEKGSLMVTISPDSCFDSMSGQGYPNSVTVSVTREASNETTELKGCGMYTLDYRLNDIWALESINGKQINPKDFPNGVPVLEFHLNDNKLYGNAGCNQINGNITVKGSQIDFGPIMSTKMACPGLATEQELLNILSEKSLGFSMENLKLTLGDAENTIVLKKVD